MKAIRACSIAALLHLSLQAMMQMRLMGQYEGKWPISLVCVSKPLITVTAIDNHCVNSHTEHLLSHISWNSLYLFISLYEPAISLIIFPLLHPLVFFQFLILNPPTELVIQQVLILSLLQTHELSHWINPSYSPNVLLLSQAQIFVVKKVVCFHKPGELHRRSVHPDWGLCPTHWTPSIALFVAGLSRWSGHSLEMFIFIQAFWLTRSASWCERHGMVAKGWVCKK